MSLFDEELNIIHKNISIEKADRKPYTAMFDTISHWLIKAMCDSAPEFKKVYKGTTLFGSYPNRVRIIKPNEYDVFILFDLKYPLEVETYPNSPGFVRIKRSYFEDVHEDDIRCLYKKITHKGRQIQRLKFKHWIQNIINYVLKNVQWPDGYNITYSNRCVAHTIYVKERLNHAKKISIDFVPAIVLHKEDVKPIIVGTGMHLDDDYFNTFVTIPKPLMGCGPKRSRRSFQIVNPVAERDMIWDKDNLKVAYRLLKSLRNNFKNLTRLKSYFITAIFLHEVEEQEPAFWREPIGDIFLHMLKVLIEYLEAEFLPFYWSPDYNLLEILKPEEFTLYTAILTNAYNRLKKLQQNQTVTYTVASHFKMRK